MSRIDIAFDGLNQWDYYLTRDGTLSQCTAVLEKDDTRYPRYSYATRRAVKHINGYEVVCETLTSMGKWRDSGWDEGFIRRGHFHHGKDFYRKATWLDKVRNPMSWLVLWANT